MQKGTPLSPLMKARIRAYPGHRYQLALNAGISPSTLSAWIVGAYSAPFGDRRALRLAEMLGVPAEKVFASAEDEQASGGAV
jgi:hypothetical protein